MAGELTTKAVEFITRTGEAELPAAAYPAAIRAFVDTLGTMLAGSAEPQGRILADFVAEEAASPRASVLGADLRTSPQLAALANGTAAHALDYDDVHMAMGHPSVALVPAVLAVSESLDVSGQDMLTAYIVGFEVAAKIGRALSGKTNNHYVHGWHSTATVGVMGAAAACAWLLHLDEAQTANALGLAASHVSGLRKNFGTMTKPYHPGNAARSGVVSARLAQAGFSADATILDSPLGYFDVLAEGPYEPEYLSELGQRFEILEPGISVKKYPCCYGTHRAADAALDLALEEQFEPDQIDSVDVHISSAQLAPLIHDRPVTGLQGKFSLQYVVSAALVDRALKLRTFTDPMVQRDPMQRLIPRVNKVVADSSGNNFDFSEVTVTVRTTDGRTLSRSCATPKGDAARPLTDAEVDEKFLDCASTVMAPAAATKILSLVRDLGSLDSVRLLTNEITAEQMRA